MVDLLLLIVVHQTLLSDLHVAPYRGRSFRRDCTRPGPSHYRSRCRRARGIEDRSHSPRAALRFSALAWGLFPADAFLAGAKLSSVGSRQPEKESDFSTAE